MSSEALENLAYQESMQPATAFDLYPYSTHRVHQRERSAARETPATRTGPRRTPRKSLIFVMPGDHCVSEEFLTRRLLPHSEQDEVDVILACAGEPRDLDSIQRRVRDLQVLLAPAGTSPEDLRELAMERAPGDIVTLMSAFPLDGAIDD